jgi:hypothetical protein
VIAVNLGEDPQPVPATGAAHLALEARSDDGRDLSLIPPHGGWIARTRRAKRPASVEVACPAM